MPQSNENKVKVRFKFRSGEEFEAEGNPDFIEKQRSDFLQLIGKDSSRASARRAAASPSTQTMPEEPQYPAAHPSTAQTEEPVLEPAAYRRSTGQSAYVSNGDTFYPSENWPKSGGISRTISAAETRQSRPMERPVTSDADIRLWEQIVRTDDKLVFLRRKSRQLSADTAALVLIAAAKVLLRATDGYSALLLSKALKKSGYGGERLDRVLAGEMRQGIVRSEGTKRSRAYLLSNEGFARAYVLASKLATEWQS